MMISGHKTQSVYQRYRIVNESDICEALDRTEASNARKQGCRIVPIAETKEKTSR